MTRVVAHDRTREGRREHVREHSRRGGASRVMDQELPPEEPHEVDVNVRVAPHESISASGKRERVKGYSYTREEERFGGKSKQVKHQIYEEYRRKGYSKAEANRIAGDTVGDVYRAKLARAGK